MFTKKIISIDAYINSFVPHIGNGTNKFNILDEIRINKDNVESVIKNLNTDAPSSYIVTFVSGSSVVIPEIEKSKL